MVLDVVVVPDFDGPARQVFEHTTNLFLASWLEHGSQYSRHQLHVVSIGEPPASTARLADQAESHLTVRTPIAGSDRFRNKLRGFEASAAGDHLMLLDTDVVLFRSIDHISRRLDPNSLALGYASGVQVSLAQWAVLYDRLRMGLPVDRVPMVNASLGSAFSDHPHFDEFSATLPYFNAGVIAVPWNFGLGACWERLIDLVPEILLNDERVAKPIVRLALYDQPPLAIAAEMLRRQGKRVSVLPDALHARWQHFCQGLVSTHDVLIAHNTGIFKRDASADILKGIRKYSELSRSRMDNRKPSLYQKKRLVEYADHLENYLSLLCQNWILEVGPKPAGSSARS